MISRLKQKEGMMPVMVIDVHAHLFGGKYKEDKDLILRAIDEYDISKVYVSGLNGYVPTKEQVAEANHEVAQFVHEQPKHIGGYVYISPEHDNALDVLKRGIEEDGMEGVKFWVSTFCDAPCVNPVVEKIIDYGVPLLIHSFHKATWQLPNETVGHNVAELAYRYPEAKIIMAHLGGNCYNGIPAIRDCPNVWVDCSDSIFRGDDLQYTVDTLGAKRVLYGTDMDGSYLVNLGQVLEMKATDEERDMILCKNALHLFDRNFKLKEGYAVI